MTNRVRQRALREDVLPVGLLYDDQVRVYVVAGTSTKLDAAVVERAHISVPIQDLVLRLDRLRALVARFRALRADFLQFVKTSLYL